jgi:hypothetical protein
MELAARKILDGTAARGAYSRIAQAVRARSVDPYTAAVDLMARFEPRFDAGGA